ELISSTENTVAQSRTTSVNSTYQDFEKEILGTAQALATARARLEGQQKAVQDYQGELAKLREAEVSLNQLTRDVMLNDETYRLNQRNATEAKAAEALD